jgi:hypothetical protein
MKALSLIYKLPVSGSALALALLISTLSVSALQTANPATSAAPPVNARPGLNTLTPTAPVSSQATPSPEDIRDIRQPRHIPTTPWAAVAVGVLLLSAGAFAARWLSRRGKFLQMLPHEIALQWLEEARQLMDPEHAREYCFAVSNIIRDYVEERFRVRAPKLTTEEFLRELVEVRDTMLQPHRALLGEFLEHCDLAKFAGWRYSMPDLEAMHATARSFVNQTAVPAEMTAAQTNKPRLAAATS